MHVEKSFFFKQENEKIRSFNKKKEKDAQNFSSDFTKALLFEFHLIKLFFLLVSSFEACANLHNNRDSQKEIFPLESEEE